MIKSTLHFDKIRLKWKPYFPYSFIYI
jgi:hypothetical protein